MSLLALTTATPRFSAALLRQGAVIADVTYDGEMKHAERLFAALDELLAAAGVTKSELEALACDVGPGSFTGVRVGLASTKGIALALGLPLVPVTSLEAMAAAAFAHVSSTVSRMVVVLDAKRGEVFFGGYDRAGALAYEMGFATAADAPGVLEAALADEATMFCGLAADGLVPDERRVNGEGCALPDARWLGRLAGVRLTKRELPDLAAVEPVYLREPDAKKPTGLPKLFTKA